jgi:hypothetical protein
VPSCKICNEILGWVEKRVFVKLAMCVDPRKVEASGMSAKALRSIGIGANAPGEEMARRQALKRRIFSMLRPLGFFGRGGLLPGLGPHNGIPAGEQIAITVPAADLMTVSEKILRGFEYVLAQRYIEEPYTLNVYFAEEEKIPDVVNLLNTVPASRLGPGFEIKRAAVKEDSGCALYKVTIWGTLAIYGSIIGPPP